MVSCRSRIGDVVVRAAAAEERGVVAGPAIERIVSVPAHERVVAGIAAQAIVEPVAGDRIGILGTANALDGFQYILVAGGIRHRGLQPGTEIDRQSARAADGPCIGPIIDLVET